ncbi:alpha-L-rhamnosidase N-terminal domain-containing protein [Streptacidiphilus sp. ASG 303]|uniref:alpha-L-rhamnosidase N-terminal domain-containing protein n=1 Tax=Streptacidiphilus sp. ASG 303 TaxID=2896847 RepID=UPI0027E0D23E|nr:alpha-L-rhamnosidase N-terminal domain-containing protein [Streptacidiphilus sp. ASG 303]
MADTHPLWPGADTTVDLAPARWIWIGGERALPNTVALFRRALLLPAAPARARLRITADSRYRLHVNGERTAWGPAPCDPRVLEADTVDLTAALHEGVNTLLVEVLYLGTGEGTYVAGRPGLLALLEAEQADGTPLVLGTDASWRARTDRSRPPGAPRRSFLRGWQETTDLRRCPLRHDDAGWRPAVALDVPADRPPIAGTLTDVVGDTWLPAGTPVHLVERGIPLLAEHDLLTAGLTDWGSADWGSGAGRADPDDWFDFRTPAPPATDSARPASWRTPEGLRLPPSGNGRTRYATWRLDRQRVGWPVVELDGPAGTVVEVVTAEGHDPDATGWLDHGQYSWSRLVLDGSPVRWEAFEYECCAWIQLHVRNPDGPVRVTGVSLRDRRYPWPHEPRIETADPALAAVLDANLNTLGNSAQDGVVDGMGRERQQYSGDGSHQLAVTRRLLGAHAQSARFLRTYARGLTRDGYFLDSWPGHDRLVRLGQNELGLTSWGSMLDHGVGFVMDCHHHWWDTGDAATPLAVLPALRRFVGHLEGLRGADGLLPVTGLEPTSVWIDHDAFAEQRHKTCAFTLYAAVMLRHAYAPLAELAGRDGDAAAARGLADDLLAAARRAFWHEPSGLWANNLPWAGSEAELRCDDRSLATSVRYGLAPDGREGPAVELLARPDARLGLSYPANAVWRFRALIAAGRIQPVLDELRTRWATLPSVVHNRTLQEMWDARPDSNAQWSHCAAGPLAAFLEGVLGCTVTRPGATALRVAPQLGDLPSAAGSVHTPCGPLRIAARAADGGTALLLDLPAGLRPAGLRDGGAVLLADPDAPRTRAELHLPPRPAPAPTPGSPPAPTPGPGGTARPAPPPTRPDRSPAC